MPTTKSLFCRGLLLLDKLVARAIMVISITEVCYAIGDFDIKKRAASFFAY
jgi:hypothetical protein